MVTITTSGALAACSTVEAVAPVSAANAASDSGPRELAIRTSCPSGTRERARVLPIRPEPMIPMSLDFSRCARPRCKPPRLVEVWTVPQARTAMSACRNLRALGRGFENRAPGQLLYSQRKTTRASRTGPSKCLGAHRRRAAQSARRERTAAAASPARAITAMAIADPGLDHYHGQTRFIAQP